MKADRIAELRAKYDSNNKAEFDIEMKDALRDLNEVSAALPDPKDAAPMQAKYARHPHSMIRFFIIADDISSLLDKIVPESDTPAAAETQQESTPAAEAGESVPVEVPAEANQETPTEKTPQ